MKGTKECFFMVCLSVCLLAASSIGWTQPAPDPKSFLIFDGTLYANKPDLSIYGIRPITMTYARQFGSDWLKDSSRLPTADSVKTLAREAQQRGQVVVLDIEHWSLKGAPDSVQESLTKYLTVLEMFQAAAPNLFIGYYGAPPIRDYWRAIKDSKSEEHRAWMAENDRLRPLATAAHVLFPSLYTFYPDQAGWKKYAIAQIGEARRYGAEKPVYVFLMPTYHDSNRMLGGSFLTEDYWLMELETVKQHADGIVIWGGWGRNNRPASWDEQAPWWTVTKEFMNRVQPPQPGNGTH